MKLDKEFASDPASSETEEDDVDTTQIFGELVGEIVEIPTSLQAPLFTIGRYKGEPVIVPFVELRFRIRGPDGDLPEFSSKLFYENVAYLMCDMAGDFQKVSEYLAEMCGPNLFPVQERLDLALQYLEVTQERVAGAIESLKRVETKRSPEESKRKS